MISNGSQPLPQHQEGTRCVAVSIASLSLACVVCAFALRLDMAPTYAEFMVGHITWRAAGKLQDLLTVPVFVASFWFAYWWLSGIARRIAATQGTDCAAEFCRALLYWSTPGLVAIAHLASAARFESMLAITAAAGLGLTALACAHVAARGKSCEPAALGLGVFAVLLATLVPFAFAVVAARLPWLHAPQIAFSTASMQAGVTGGCALAWLLGVALLRPASLHAHIRTLLILSQAAIPLLFVALLPAGLRLSDGTLVRYQTTSGLGWLIGALVVWGFVDVWRRARRPAMQAASGLGSTVSPIALLAVLVALKLGGTAAPSVPADDYHFGEALLGWWSYLHGTVPYVGHVPSHGLIDDDLPAMLSWLFYDGSAASLHEAARVSRALLAIVACLSILRFSGSVGLAFAATLFLDVRLSWLFLAPFCWLWFGPSLRGNPHRWLTVWLLTAPLAFLGVPPQGGLLIAASGVVALVCARRAHALRSDSAWLAPLAASAFILIAAVATPLGAMAIGAAMYVLENGPINQVAYGIPWSLSWAGADKPAFLLEVFRMSWLVVPMVCVWVLLIRPMRTADRSQALPALAMLIFSLLLIPYAMGRIDPGSISRPGFIAALGWTLLLPVAIWPVLRFEHKPLLIALVVACGALLNTTPVAPTSLAAAVASEIAAGAPRNTRAAGLPNLGNAVMQDEHWQRLLRLKSVLDRHLSPGEPYLDLSNRIAQHFYLDRRPLIPVAAPFNMAAVAQQREALRLLGLRPPRLVLIDSDNTLIEDGKLSLRTPLLYRYIVENYVPVVEDGMVIGLPRKADSTEQRMPIEATIRDITDENWVAGVHRRDHAVALENPGFAERIPIGTWIDFPDGDSRKVARVWKEGNALWFEGARKDGPGIAAPARLATSHEEIRLTLFEKAFSQADLAKIPIAWGRSSASLTARSRLVLAAGIDPRSLHDLRAANDQYLVAGADPTLHLDLASVAFAGRDAGILKLEFACIGMRADPRLQVFWWGDGETGPKQRSSVVFTAADGIMLVPLDAAPRWLALRRIKGIRIDLDNPSACGAIRVSNVELRQRALTQ